MRSPLQGVVNVVRFNWPFYAVTLLVVVPSVALVLLVLPMEYAAFGWLFLAGVVAASLLSLLASAYVYDWSDLYTLPFVRGGGAAGANILNVNAGFDETSLLLRQRYPEANLMVVDFYDPTHHTEASIERARRAYPSYPGTRSISTDYLPVEDGTVDLLFLILAAHEIRDAEERVTFFRECRRVLASNGEAYVTEHLRDWANFLVYNVGFFHFHSRRSWLGTFAAAGLSLRKEHKTTPFISTFILTANDRTA